MKLQYDLEGGVLERKRPFNWGSKLALAGLCLVVLMVGSAIGSILYQRYYEPRLVTLDQIGETTAQAYSLDNGSSTPSSVSGKEAEEIWKCVLPIPTWMNPSKILELDAPVFQIKVEENDVSFTFGPEGDSLTEIPNDSYMRALSRAMLAKLFFATSQVDHIDRSVDLSDIEVPQSEAVFAKWVPGSTFVHPHIFRYENGQWTFAVTIEDKLSGVKGSDEENNSGDHFQKASSAESGHHKDSSEEALIETDLFKSDLESEKFVEQLDVFRITPSVHPVEDLGLDTSIMEFKLDEEGLSVQYGQDKNSMTEISRDSGVGSMVGWALQELFLATKGLEKSGREVDLSDIEFPVDEEMVWNFAPDSQILVFRYEDGEWTFDVREENESSNANSPTEETKSDNDSHNVSSGESNASSFLEKSTEDDSTEYNTALKHNPEADQVEHSDENSIDIFDESEDISTLLKDLFGKSSDEPQKQHEVFHITPPVDPVEDLGLDTGILEFKLNEDGLSVKYGHDDDSLTDVSHDSFVGSFAGLVLQELLLSTKGLEEPGRRVDLSDIEVPLEDEEDVWKWTPGSQGFKFRYEDGEWTFDIREETVSSSEENKSDDD